ncbi:MAG: YidC/Oxa1 family membrane protein insertase [Actinomycetota bacterium]
MTHLIAALPWSPLFQGLLNGIGWVLAKIYDLVPNYGAAIILLTILIRVVLLPLGVKQIKSMQAMQAIQPKVKEIQKKYKSNKQKINEETMKLYAETGVNPLGSILPVLLQFPILISMYAVIRPPQVIPMPTDGTPTSYEIHNNHLPVDSALFHNVVSHQGTDFLLMNLQCSASQAGTSVILRDSQKEPIQADKPLVVDGRTLEGVSSQGSLDCGSGVPVKVPYFLMVAFMIATTFYQQRQMTKAAPPGAQTGQQQTILKIMPVMFGFFAFTFPAGLVVYWITSNLWQIGQQAALLRAGHIGPDALERRQQEMATRPAKTGGMFSGMVARAEEERRRRDAQGANGAGRPVKSSPKTPQQRSGKGSGTTGRKPPPGGGRPSAARGGPPKKPRPKRPGGDGDGA